MWRIVALLITCWIPLTAQAQQSYPSHTLRAVIPWPPGQATDLAGRVVAQRLSEVLGQAVIPDNRAGAGGSIGTDHVAKAAADGYTLLIASSGPISVNPLLQKLPYEVERDFIPVARIGMSHYLLVTGASFPATNAREFVDLVRARPGHYGFASSGTGATAHIVAELFNKRAGLTAVHVPYKGSSAALTDVMTGQVAYATETISATMPLVRSGRLRAYGITSAKASGLAPGIEPLADSLDLPGLDAGAWVGVMVAAGTPPTIVDRLSAAISAALQSPEVSAQLRGVGIEPAFLPAAEFGQYLSEQRMRFSEIIRSANIKLE